MLTFLFGLMMRGMLFQPQGGDLLTTVIILRRFHLEICCRGFCICCFRSGWRIHSRIWRDTFTTTGPNSW